MDKGRIRLTGETLTLEELERIAVYGENVEVVEEAWERVRAARKLIFDLDKRGVAVYGLNRGVGWNKDKKVFAQFYDRYNRNLLRSHMIGVGPECSQGGSPGYAGCPPQWFSVRSHGRSEEIVEYYLEFINRGIHPIVKKRGSVGEADIGTLSGIGLVIIGEGEAWYANERMSGGEALKRAGLVPLLLGPKDGLGVVSSNARGRRLLLWG